MIDPKTSPSEKKRPGFKALLVSALSAFLCFLLVLAFFLLYTRL